MDDKSEYDHIPLSKESRTLFGLQCMGRVVLRLKHDPLRLEVPTCITL